MASLHFLFNWKVRGQEGFDTTLGLQALKANATQFHVLWVVYCFLLDIMFWIVLPHPWRLTAKELFVSYQPWISLVYLAIFISPMIGVIYLLI